MDRVRVSVIGVVLTAVLASGLLWLVPAATRQVEGRSGGERTDVITSDEAHAQVKATMDALEAGISQGNLDLALVGFATGDAEWLVAQRQRVAEIVGRLQGHPAKLHYGHPSFWGHTAGGQEVVSRRVYAGPTLVVDAVTNEIVGEVERYAIAPEGRFVLHPFPQEDDNLRIAYASGLGGLYAQLGQPERAMETWLRVLTEFPDSDASAIVRVHEQVGRVRAEAGDLAAAYASFERALALVEGHHNSTSMVLQGVSLLVRGEDNFQFLLADTAERMGDAAKARTWYSRLQDSETQELAVLAAERLKTLQ